MEKDIYNIFFINHGYSDLDIEKKVLEEINCSIYEINSNDEKYIAEKCENADAIIINLAPITKKVIDNLKKCKVISRYGIGVDVIDLKAAKTKNIIVCNVSDYCLDEVSDHALALIFTLGRKILLYNNEVKKGKWDAINSGKPITNFRNSILGIIGFGKISRNLYKKSKNIFKNIYVFDPYIKLNDIKKFRVYLTNLQDLLSNSDYISINCPLNNETFHMIGKKELQLMKPTAIIVNTSRGAIIDTEVLYDFLANKRIGGAGLDVLEKEPIDLNNKLLFLDNIIITPHAGFYSESSLKKLKYTAALNVLRVLKNKKPINVVSNSD